MFLEAHFLRIHPTSGHSKTALPSSDISTEECCNWVCGLSKNLAAIEVERNWLQTVNLFKVASSHITSLAVLAVYKYLPRAYHGALKGLAKDV